MRKEIRRWESRIIAVLLVFILTACGQEVSAVKSNPGKVHQPVDYTDMVFTGFDETNLQDAFAELEELSDSGALQKKDVQTQLRVEELYGVIRTEMDILYTQIALIGIQYDRNGAEEQLAEKSAELSANGSGSMLPGAGSPG